MVVQEIAYLVQDQNVTITIVSEKSNEEIEASAYLLRRLLYTAEKLSADNIKITVKENDFEGVKKLLGK